MRVSFRRSAVRPVSGRPRKTRLDALLVERGFAPNHSRARALVMAGHVYRGEQRLEKPGSTLPIDAALEVRARAHPWVSRGGSKLAHGLDHFGIDPRDRIALDIGASTGGFTQVLLARGARRVYAVDVGRGQLDWSLRRDTRVVVLEDTNARSLTRRHVPEAVELVTCDASFIGLATVLPQPLALAAVDAVVVALIKPQFEVGKGRVGKGGIVRDPAQHDEVCRRIRDWLQSRPGWSVLGVTESPIIGSKGNREFLIAARRNP